MQRLKNFWGDLSTTRGKLKLLIIISGLLLIIAAVGAVALEVTSQPQFCSSCHEMQPEFTTWQVSAHGEADVSCIQCHVEPGFTNLVKDKVNALKQVYEHVTKTYPSPITAPHAIESFVCEQCHDVAEIKPEGELIIPHDKHVNASVECVTCHSGVAHANVASRGLTTDGNWDVWNEEKANEEMVSKNTLPSMEKCISCHQERQVDTSCATCHTKVGKPESHQLTDWAVKHGSIAKSDAQNECAQCHGTVIKAENLADYSRQSEFCTSCHQQKPQSHNADWVMNHKETALQNLQTCFSCHDRTQTDNSNSPSKINCNTCHNL